ncbi:hypothetical protein J2Y69_000170 [Microbacterium resistens]|uniref:Lipoprotein n=1 Tax=Microbacterium resistens TaxID=156977 RepID=A0ABU1S7K1_9MICO|nr:hypothetical protein [Microbacterium resistens]MDR6865588.1 hypothetical protein [Microbacterium resistens]
MTLPRRIRRRRLVRTGATAFIAITTSVLAGCSSGYDGVLWRQMDAAENPLYDELVEAQRLGATPAEMLASLQKETLLWDGGGAPESLRADESAVVVYGFTPGWRGAEKNALLSFDALIFSGPRDPEIPRDEIGARGGERYTGPSAVYTCFTIEAQFTDGALRSWDRSFDPDCPKALVDALGAGAQYERPTEFDG